MRRNRAGKPTQPRTARSGKQREAQGREHENNRLHSYPPPPPPELSDSPAKPTVWRWLTRGLLPVLLLAPLCPLLAPAALAQTVLLDTIGTGSSGNNLAQEYATPFTTGTNPFGYTISEVVINLHNENSASNPAPVVTIRELVGGNRPGDRVAMLNNPSTFVDDNNTFTAPPGTALSPNTTYYLVFNDGNAGTEPIRSASVTVAGKQGGAADWDVPSSNPGDPIRGLRRNSSSDAWTENRGRLRFSIRGNPINYAPTIVDNRPPPLDCDALDPLLSFWEDPKGYCLAKSPKSSGARDATGTGGLGLRGNPAAFIETATRESKHDRMTLNIRETACGTNKGSFRIRTLNWQFPDLDAGTTPVVRVVATTGRWIISEGPGNERRRSSTPYTMASGSKGYYNGEYGLPVPIARHDGEQVVEVDFTVESDSNASFEFQLVVANRDANQKYNVLGWRDTGAFEYGPSIHVDFEKNFDLDDCRDQMSGSNSPPETQNSPPDAVIIGQGQPAAVPEGAPSDDESPYAAVLADAEKAVAETDKGEIHVDRWHRVLAALGVDNGHTPMPASEAQGYVDRGWTRWEPVAAALAAIEEEAANPQPETVVEPSTDTTDNTPDPVVDPAACVSDELVNDVRGYSEETVSTDSELQSAYVERWLRVLQTFAGTANDSTIMLPAEARTYRDKGWARWIPVVDAIECLEERAAE